MKIDTPPSIVFLLDFCRQLNCQQIRVLDTNKEELKAFLLGIFLDKRNATGKTKAKDGTLIRVRCINTKEHTSKKIVNIRVYNISPTQARIYTIKCMKYYFQNETANDF